MRKSVIYFISLAVIGSMLAGCGGSSKSSYAAAAPAAMTEEAYDYDYATDDLYAYEEPAEAAYAEVNKTAQGIQSTGNDEIVAKNRKIIKTVNLTAETEEFDTFIANVTQRVESLGGYLENTDISGRSLSSKGSLRRASLTARIPASKLNDFVSNVEETSNITYKTESAEDVTLNYADTEARISSLRTEQTRLNELIATAEDVDTLIMLEQRLTEVRYEIESYESRLRSMDDKIDYSTVYLVVNEVEKYTPDPEIERTVGQRISEGFAESFKDVCEGMVNLFVGIVVGSPYIIAFLIIIGIIVIVVILIIKLISYLASKSEKKRIQKLQKSGVTPNVVSDAVYKDLKPVVMPEKADNKQTIPAQDAKKPEANKADNKK